MKCSSGPTSTFVPVVKESSTAMRTERKKKIFILEDGEKKLIVSLRRDEVFIIRFTS
uniref:Uncharacterized protein n=1 Tax=Lepeophtheirus salmonis TaxID=72036 RepID=A0A0K2TGJ2_LEPSM